MLQSSFDASVSGGDQSAGLHFMTGWAGDNLDQVNFYLKCNL